MNLGKLFLAGILLSFMFLFTGCQGNNSDVIVSSTPDTNTTILPDANVTTLILPVTSSTLTLNRENLQIEVRVELNGSPLTTGSVKVVNPSSTSRPDVGYFDNYDVSLDPTGTATFSYNAPETLDDNVSDIVFSFYHTSDLTTVSSYTVSLAPTPNQVELFNYFLNATPDSNLTLGLQSSLLMSFSVATETSFLDNLDIVSIKVETLNSVVGKLRDTNNSDALSITVLGKNNVSVSVDSNETSGIIPLKVTATYKDGNGTIQDPIEKVYSVTVLSGPPTSVSIDYKGTAHADALFKDTMIVVIRDEYGNLVNTQTGISTSVFSGYAVDSTGPLNYMYHTNEEPIAGTLEGTTFTLDSGVVTQINLTNEGAGYTTAPSVSLAGGDGGFTANAVLSTTGAITGVNVVNSGSGYTTAPIIEAIGEGSGFSATANLSSSGGFASISIDNKGLGYTSIPTVSATGGGSGFTATAALEATGSLKDTITVTNAGDGYALNQQLVVLGDGTGAIVRVSKIVADAATGPIESVKVWAKGSGYKSGNTEIYAGDSGNGAALLDVEVGYSIASITIDSPGTGYANSALTLSGTPDEAAVLSAVLNYSLDSVTPITIISGGSGYSTPLISITGDGSDALALATVTYSVNKIEIVNGGTGYTDGALVFDNTGTGGIGATATAEIFSSTDLLNVDDENYKLALFGKGYVYDASGKWDIRNDGILNQLSIIDTFDGNKTENLGFAIGNNQRNDLCEAGKKWGTTTNVVGGSEFSTTGIVDIEIEYNHYMVAKDVMMMVNLVGEQNSLGQIIKIGEGTKHNLRGTGLSTVPDKIDIAENENFQRHRVYIKMNDTAEYLKNANFNFIHSVVGTGITVHSISTSMDNGIKSCSDSFGGDVGGSAYIDFVVSSDPEKTGSITIGGLLIRDEF